MVKPVSICVRMNRGDYLDFKRLSLEKGMDVYALADRVIHEYLDKRRDAPFEETSEERRHYPRKKLSIPAVSLVNFVDNETGSYPVVLEDISKGGVRIHFKKMGAVMNEKISKATEFEIVFSVPQTSLTVSLFCKRKRISMDNHPSMVGTFTKTSEPTISMMSDFFDLEAVGLG